MAEIRDEVREEVRRRFPREVEARVVRALSDMEDPPASSPSWSRARARVHLAIIKLADGNLDRLLANVVQAQIDWRDTLCAAGLENDDWPQVLQAAGYAVPE
jgi:hypothetical protein